MNKMIEKFKNERIAVHCNTQEEYDELMELLEKYGFRWRSGSKPTAFDSFETYGSETCVDNKEDLAPSLGFCYKEYFTTKNYEIIECKDFIKLVDFEERINTSETIITINKDGLSITKHLCESDCDESVKEEQIENEFEQIEIKQEKTVNGDLINYAIINGQKCRLSLVQYEIIKKLNSILEFCKDDEE
jgi:virulence-associated protein VapD